MTLKKKKVVVSKEGLGTVKFHTIKYPLNNVQWSISRTKICS